VAGLGARVNLTKPDIAHHTLPLHARAWAGLAEIRAHKKGRWRMFATTKREGAGLVNIHEHKREPVAEVISVVRNCVHIKRGWWPCVRTDHEYS